MATVRTNLAKMGKITSVEEALDASNLNFVTEQTELMGVTNGLFAPDHKMLYRPDTNNVLGIVGTKYHPIQNSLAMAFMDTIVQKHGFTYTEAISKDGGAVTIMTAQSEKEEEVRKGDVVCKQIRMINGFNGKSGFGVEFSMLRLVCTNGMTRNEKESVVRFKHTTNVSNRMEVSLKVFDESVGFHDDFIKKSQILAQKSADKLMVEKFLNGLYGDAKQNDAKKEKIVSLFESGQGNNGDTLWDLYCGATEYYNHFDGTSEEKRLDSFYFGNASKKNSDAWNIAMSLV